MSAPDLLYSEVEDDLRKNLRTMLRQRCDPTTILGRCEGQEPYDLGLWRTIATELGLAGLLVPEKLGGSGASTKELAVLAEEMGRSVAPVPFLGNVLSTAGLMECYEDCEAARLLAGLADGSLIGTLATGLSTDPAAPFPRSVRGSGATLTGSISAVVDLEVADVVLVPAVDEAGPALYAVEVPASNLSRTASIPLDLTRRIGMLDLTATPATRIASTTHAQRALHRALLTGAGMLASEQVGLAQYCLDSTVDYALMRYQFGRAIGSFQAIKHRLADLWSDVSTARATARNAADALAGSEETELAVALAQAYCSDLVVRAAEEHLQLHGGIAMTWEHPAHLYLGRAKSSQLSFGSADRHRMRVGELADLPNP